MGGDVATTDLSALILDGRRKLRDKDFTGAAECLARAVEANPASVEANELAARCAFMQRDYEAAAGHFQRAANCDTRRIEPLINLGAVLNIQKDHAGAVKTLQSAVSKRAGRSNAEAYYNLGIAYRGLGQPSMAVQAYREAIRLNSNFAEAHQNLGNAYVDLNNLRQARASFKRALELKPSLAGAKKGLARVDAAESAGDAPRQFAHGQTGIKRAIELTETSRINDRAVLRDISETLDRSLKAWAAELRLSVEPGVRSTVKGISGSVDGPALRRAADGFEGGIETCNSILSVLNQSISDLREHENSIVESANQKLAS